LPHAGSPLCRWTPPYLSPHRFFYPAPLVTWTTVTTSHSRHSPRLDYRGWFPHATPGLHAAFVGFLRLSRLSLRFWTRTLHWITIPARCLEGFRAHAARAHARWIVGRTRTHRSLPRTFTLPAAAPARKSSRHSAATSAPLRLLPVSVPCTRVLVARRVRWRLGWILHCTFSRLHGFTAPQHLLRTALWFAIFHTARAAARIIFTSVLAVSYMPSFAAPIAPLPRLACVPPSRHHNCVQRRTSTLLPCTVPHFSCRSCLSHFYAAAFICWHTARATAHAPQLSGTWLYLPHRLLHAAPAVSCSTPPPTIRFAQRGRFTHTLSSGLPRNTT